MLRHQQVDCEEGCNEALEEDHYVEYDEDEIQATIANVYNDPKRKLNEILGPLRITLKIFL